MRQRDTILIVDDMEINRVILDGLFQEEYHLLEAENGEQALLLLRQYHGFAFAAADRRAGRKDDDQIDLPRASLQTPQGSSVPCIPW